MSHTIRRFRPTDDDAVLAFTATLPEHDLLFSGRDLRHPRVIEAWQQANLRNPGIVAWAATSPRTPFASNDISIEAQAALLDRIGSGQLAIDYREITPPKPSSPPTVIIDVGDDEPVPVATHPEPVVEHPEPEAELLPVGQEFIERHLA